MGCFTVKSSNLVPAKCTSSGNCLISTCKNIVSLGAIENSCTCKH